MRKIYQKMTPKEKNRSKGVLGGFINSVILRSCNSESRPLSFNQAGFTLIELLVVVLIIGILAAVALPQYGKAVKKTQATEALINLKTLKEAEERYWLANGKYTDSLEDLDVQIQGKYFTYRCSVSEGCEAWAQISGMPDFLFTHNHVTWRKDKRYCRVVSYAEQEEICKALGGVEIDPPYLGYRSFFELP